MKLVSGAKILDVASGTGDIAFGIHNHISAKLNNKFTRITSDHNAYTLHLSDINSNMLNVARDKYQNQIVKHDLINVDIKESNAEQLDEFNDDY